ncbi:uncharacterized protein LOC116805014 [Drosophila grimshawi]|uniref:uncharacterized protein LOC116805014 n=1 Tax=Drosophila grimshawi TaxID=7222 RepID=UPI0013EF3876|nr:uncharacterized protein LOC116805014 [Drosophila grimshawi]
MATAPTRHEQKAKTQNTSNNKNNSNKNKNKTRPHLSCLNDATRCWSTAKRSSIVAVVFVAVVATTFEKFNDVTLREIIEEAKQTTTKNERETQQQQQIMKTSSCNN